MFARVAYFRPVALWISLAILAAYSSPAWAQTADSQWLTVQGYIAELDRCSTVLNASSLDPAAVRGLRTSLPPSWNVTTGEAHYTIPTQWLSGDLLEIEKNSGARTPALDQARQKIQLYRHDAQALEDSIASPRNLAGPRSRM